MFILVEFQVQSWAFYSLAWGQGLVVEAVRKFYRWNLAVGGPWGRGLVARGGAPSKYQNRLVIDVNRSFLTPDSPQLLSAKSAFQSKAFRSLTFQFGLQLHTDS